MTDSITVQMCFLWEDELRAAARALRALHEAPEEMPDNEHRELVKNALNTSLIALWGLTDEHACVMIGSGELNKRAKKRRVDPPQFVETQEANDG